MSSPTPRGGWSPDSTRSGCGADARLTRNAAPPNTSLGARLSGDYVGRRRLCRHEAGTPPCHPGQRRQNVGRPWHRQTMTHKRQLRGVELRYALTLYLFQHSPKTRRRPHRGAGVPGLRHPRTDLESRVGCLTPRDPARQGVSSYKRGRYGPGEMPRATEYRIHQRVLALRSEAAVIASQNDVFVLGLAFRLSARAGSQPSSDESNKHGHVVHRRVLRCWKVLHLRTTLTQIRCHPSITQPHPNSGEHCGSLSAPSSIGIPGREVDKQGLGQSLRCCVTSSVFRPEMTSSDEWRGEQRRNLTASWLLAWRRPLHSGQRLSTSPSYRRTGKNGYRQGCSSSQLLCSN